MISKRAYLSRVLTLVAGLIFLAHTTIPHHHHDHHDQRICFGANHCDCSTIPHGEDHTDHHHPFDNQSQTHQCCISEFIPVSSIELPRLGKFEDSKNPFVPDAYYFLLPEQILFKAWVRKSIICHHKIKHPLGVKICSSSGLRAPPQV